MSKLNIFKLEYFWYEGEHEETYLAKDTDEEGFEKDLSEARKFAENLKGVKAEMGRHLGKGYSVECLPQFFEQMVWFLTAKKGYKECYIKDNLSYIIDDTPFKKISITKQQETIKNVCIR